MILLIQTDDRRSILSSSFLPETQYKTLARLYAPDRSGKVSLAVHNDEYCIRFQYHPCSTKHLIQGQHHQPQ